MDRLYHPYWRHARNFLAIALLLAAGSALFGLAGWDERVAWGLLAVAATPLLIGLIITVIALLTDRRLRRLQREQCYLSWRYGDSQWSDYLALDRRKSRWAGLGAGAALVWLSLIFATIAYFDEQTWFGSALYNWLLPSGVGVFLGAAAWVLIRWNRELGWRAMRRLGGRFLLGPSGFYITGQFRPLEGFSQVLSDLTFQSGEAPALLFRFHVDSGRYSENQHVRVPVPPGRVAEVKRFLADQGLGIPEN